MAVADDDREVLFIFERLDVGGGNRNGGFYTPAHV